MANTLTSMQARIFADSAIRKFNSILTPFKAFARDFSNQTAMKGDVVRVPVFPTVSAGSYSGSYSATDRTITGTDISINQHIFISTAFTDREIAESPADYFTNMGAQAAKGVAKSFLTTTWGSVTAANFGNTSADKVTIAAASFTSDYVADLRTKLFAKGIAAPEASLIMDTAYWTALLKESTLTAAFYGGAEAVRGGQIPQLFGFDGVYESAIIPGNSENLVGFACSPQAIGVAIRYLKPQSTVALIDAGYVSDEETGVTLGIRVIPEPLAGKVHYVVECLYGYSVIDGTSLVRLLSA